MFFFIFTNPLWEYNYQSLLCVFNLKSLLYSYFGKLFGHMFQSFTCVLLSPIFSSLTYTGNRNEKRYAIAALFQQALNWKLRDC